MLRRAKSQAPLSLSAWIEANIVLPDVVAVPGPLVLAPYMRAIADAIGDPAIERVSVLKSARIGFSTVLTAAIAYHVVKDPCAVLVLLPTQDDCRDYVVSDVERLFEASPRLRKRLSGPKAGGDRINRNTLTHRLFRGGDLKVVAGKAPRNLRRHTARILLVDEADAIEASAEGDPITLAERRTLSFANRKIITGGTPLDESTSAIARLYRQSDQRVWEVPCPACGAFHEIAWPDFEWKEGRPERAAWRCPSCKALVGEESKEQMVTNGRWHAQRPEARGHAGFRINALTSLLPGAAWPKLAEEYERAKDDPATLRVFANTILGQPWREEGDDLDEDALAAKAEPFDLDNIPAEVLAVTVGIDVQGDRFEATIVGWSKEGALVLAHETIWTDPQSDAAWHDLDTFLRQRFRHPHGGQLKVDAAAIDAGDGGIYDRVLAFCAPRLARKVLAIKGVAGFARPAIARAKLKKGAPLFLVGVDAIKSQLFAKLERGRAVRFSRSLSGEWYEQLTSERRVVRVVRGKPLVRFERKPGMRAEALDALVYATAARAALNLSAAAFAEREDELRRPPDVPPPKRPPSVIRSQWMERP